MRDLSRGCINSLAGSSGEGCEEEGEALELLTLLTLLTLLLLFRDSVGGFPLSTFEVGKEPKVFWLCSELVVRDKDDML